MSYFLLNALLQLAKGGAKYYDENEKFKNANISICRDCKTENPKGANFCGRCRSRNLTGRQQAQKEAIVENKRKHEESLRVAHFNRRMKLANDYYNQFSKYRICHTCNVSQQPSEGFCVKCGSQNNEVPSYVLLEWMKTEFPDLIHSYDDIRKVQNFDNPYDNIFGKIVVKGAGEATKLTLKAAGLGIKSIFKEVNRKYIK